jgi:hypothetical protein
MLRMLWKRRLRSFKNILFKGQVKYLVKDQIQQAIVDILVMKLGRKAVFSLLHEY